MGELDFWQGMGIAIEIQDLCKRWVIALEGEKLVVYPRSKSAQASISGNVKEFILLASRKEDPDTLFFQRRLSIEGDTELSLGLKNLIDSLEPIKIPRILSDQLDRFLHIVS